MIYTNNGFMVDGSSRKVNTSEFEIKARHDGRGIIRNDMLFPPELVGKKVRIRVILIKKYRGSNKMNKYPLGCQHCPERDDCRDVKLNYVIKCVRNRENLIKYGYRKRKE